jgi:hypothetical protein
MKKLMILVMVLIVLLAVFAAVSFSQKRRTEPDKWQRMGIGDEEADSGGSGRTDPLMGPGTDTGSVQDDDMGFGDPFTSDRDDVSEMTAEGHDSMGEYD